MASIAFKWLSPEIAELFQKRNLGVLASDWMDRIEDGTEQRLGTTWCNHVCKPAVLDWIEEHGIAGFDVAFRVNDRRLFVVLHFPDDRAATLFTLRWL